MFAEGTSVTGLINTLHDLFEIRGILSQTGCIGFRASRCLMLRCLCSKTTVGAAFGVNPRRFSCPVGPPEISSCDEIDLLFMSQKAVKPINVSGVENKKLPSER
jgi:hypothetical protein